MLDVTNFFGEQEDRELALLILQGVEETGEDAENWFFMSPFDFAIELIKEPKDRRIVWTDGWRKRSTGKSIWIVGMGAAE